MSKSAVVGLLSGITVVILTLIAVAVINLPEAEGAVPGQLQGSTECPAVRVAQDQGYEITRTVIRKVCGSASAE